MDFTMSHFRRGFGMAMGYFAAKAVAFIIFVLVIILLASL